MSQGRLTADGTRMQTTRVLQETVVLCSQPRELGAKISADQVSNWRTRGILPRKSDGSVNRKAKRVTLEWAMQGGVPVTSREAYMRFCRRINGEEE